MRGAFVGRNRLEASCKKKIVLERKGRGGEYFDLFSARWLYLGCQGPSALSVLATWQTVNHPAGIESNRHVHLEGILLLADGKGPETFL